MAIQVAGTTVIGNSRSLENIASVDATTVSTLTTALTGKQTADAELTAVSGLTTNGLITKTGAGTAATRTVTGTANQITVTNGDGVSGNPTIAAVVASQAEAQAGTDNTKLMTPSRVRNAFNASGSAPVYACRAWVNFNGTGTVAIRASGNVTSITDNGTGDYTVNLTTAMPDTNYAVIAMSEYTNVRGDSYANHNAMAAGYPMTSSTANIKTITPHSGYFDCQTVSVSIFR